ncbi:hypothetical protein GDO86_010933 [Hymenochirus boettgeri]|uniref:Telomeric repeat-binding factor n=1 Tax=Hymenochirus boettgeri TaxID=247094 RepID=A0A8T2JHJ6_9PIPI|nr:hypothetical protein GDO86_010933 [Hymenochirus boettgeri]
MGEPKGGPPFDEVAVIATDWMCDFLFTSLCHYFTEGRTDNFQRSIRILECLFEDVSIMDTHRKSILIAQFLTRVTEGKNLDTHFEVDESLTPLESAIVVFDQMKEEENSLMNLHEEIELLLKVQAVVTCMEKGKFKLSCDVLDRLFEESESNKYLRTKLAMLIEKKDPYHEFLQNFTHAQMLKKIKSYITFKMNERPPVFLLEAATKVADAKAESVREIQSKENDSYLQEDSSVSCSSDDKENHYSFNDEETDEPQKRSNDSGIKKSANKEFNFSSESEESDTALKDTNNSITQNEPSNKSNIQETTEKSIRSRNQRRLFSIGFNTPWNPDTQYTSGRLLNSINIANQNRRNEDHNRTVNSEKASGSGVPKKRQHWTWEEDELLKKGVKKYGVGNWSKILIHYPFNSRTGVMLKDRWRTMKRLNMVENDNGL